MKQVEALNSDKYIDNQIQPYHINHPDLFHHRISRVSQYSLENPHYVCHF